MIQPPADPKLGNFVTYANNVDEVSRTSGKQGAGRVAMRVPADERREQLISATMELMRREGVQSVTMRAIAKEAKAPLATAHYCFGDKSELMAAAARAWLKNLNLFSHDISVHLGLRKAVMEVAEEYWRLMSDEPDSLLSEIEVILWATRNSAGSPLAAKIYPAYAVELGNIFAAAAESDEHHIRMDTTTLVRSFLMIYDGAALQYISDPMAPGLRSMFFDLVDALLIKAGV